MRIVIACGASGGHIFPAMALAQELAKRKDITDILMICSSRPLDIEILRKSGYDYKVIPYNPFTFTLNPLKIVPFFIKLAIGVILSIRLLLRFRPQGVIGFGGFVSGPVIIAAWLLHIPRLIHEQNLIAGLANRMGAFFAQRVAVSFEETKKFFKKDKVIRVGNPVRGNFLNLDKVPSKDRFGLDEDRLTLFVTGGSQGATFLNNIVVDALGIMDYQEKRKLQVIHITGESDYKSVKQRYIKENIKSKVFSFLDEIERAYTAADLVIARAGATTIAELTYFGKPAILIPYPKRGVHQMENAHFLSSNNAAITVEEKDLDAERMKELTLSLLLDGPRLEEMACNSKRLGNPEASKLLAKEVFRVLNVRE